MSPTANGPTGPDETHQPLTLSGGVSIGATMATAGYRHLHELAASAVCHGAMALFWGKAGLGKTVAIRRFLDSRPANYRTLYLDAADQPTVKTFARMILGGLIGYDVHEDLYELGNQIRRELSPGKCLEQPVVIAVDEVQRLGLRQLEWMRWLHDQKDTNCCIIWVGGPSAWTAVRARPMLRDRLLHTYRYPAMTKPEFLTLAPQFHAVYAHLNEELLGAIFDEAVHGRMRHLARLTHEVLTVMRIHRLDVVRWDVVQAALDRIGGPQEDYAD